MKDVFHILQEVLLTVEPALLQPPEHSQDICGMPARSGDPAAQAISLSCSVLCFYFFFFNREVFEFFF